MLIHHRPAFVQTQATKAVGNLQPLHQTLLNVNEAAAYLGLSRSSFYRHALNDLRALGAVKKISKRIFLRKEVLDRFVADAA